MNLFLKRQIAFALVLVATCPSVVSAAGSADPASKARIAKSANVNMWVRYESPTPISKLNTVIVTPSLPSSQSSVHLRVSLALGAEQAFFLDYDGGTDAESWVMYNEIVYNKVSKLSEKVKVSPGAQIEVSMEKKDNTWTLSSKDKGTNQTASVSVAESPSTPPPPKSALFAFTAATVRECEQLPASHIELKRMTTNDKPGKIAETFIGPSSLETCAPYKVRRDPYGDIIFEWKQVAKGARK